jgi:fatty acid desaturase
MNPLQLWSLGAFILIALTLAGSLIWIHFGNAIKGFRWNYRNASAVDISKAPLIALIATMFIAIPLWFKECAELIWGFLKEDFGVIVCSILLIVSFPVSFPVIAWVSRKSARKEVLKWKKRDLRARVYA